MAVDDLRCPECGFEAQNRTGLASHRRGKGHDGYEKREPAGWAAKQEPASGSDNPFEVEVGTDVVPATALEANGKKGWRAWFGAKKAATPRPPKERRPRPPAGKRQSAATLLGMPFEEGAELIMPRLPATGRMLQLEAPYAGHILDEAVAGTMVDRLAVQPVVRVQGRLEMVGSVLAPPLIVMQMELHPERAYQLYPFLRRSIKMAAPYIAMGLKRHKEDEEKLAAVLDDLYPTGEEAAPLPPGMDKLDAMLFDILNMTIWTRQPKNPPARPEPEAAPEETANV